MRILVIEDNALLRHHLSVQMREMGHQVDAAEDAKEARIIFCMSTRRISRLSISVYRVKTA
jgi:DNA-binding response OmpR family regulator